MADRADVLLDIPSTGTLGTDAVGNEATDRTSELNFAGATSRATYISLNNPAIVSGVITKIEVYIQALTGPIQIGSFYSPSSGVYSTRDYATFGALAAGKHTLTTDADGKPLAIDIASGDYIGITSTASPWGAIEALTSTGSGVRWVDEQVWPIQSVAFTSLANHLISLKAYIAARTSHLLASDKNGNLAWQVEEAPVLRPGLAQGAVSYADVPPEQEMVWDMQRTMHGGFGQLEWLDPTRYMSADKVDTRFKNKVFCGPLLITTYLASGADLFGLNGPIYCGCDHEKATYIGAGHGVYQMIRPFTLTTVATTKIATFAIVAGDNNDTITLSGTASPAWDTDILTAGRKIKISGRANPAHDGLFTVVSCTSTVLTVAEGLTANETGTVGTIFTTDIWVLVKDAGDSYIRSLVSSNGYIYACPAGLGWLYSDTGNNTPSWTAATSGTLDYDLMLSLNGNLWGFRGRNLANVATVSPVDNGTDFDGAYKIGDSSYDFTWVLNHRDILLAGKEDGLYSIDTYGNAHHVLPDLRLMSNPLNFRRMVSWSRAGMVFMPIGYGGLWAWGEGQQPRDLSPRVFAPHDDNFHGVVGGLAPDANWLFAVVRGAASGSYYNVGLLAGSFIDDEYGTRWVWHPLASWIDDDAHMAFLVRFATDYNSRLWIGRGDYTPNYITLPRYTDNPLEATDDAATDYAYHFSSDGWVITSWWDGGLRGMTKAFSRLTVNASNLCNITAAATEEKRYITIDYQIDDGSWVLAATSGFSMLPTAEDDGVTDETTFSFPSSATGKRIRLRFNFITTKKVASAAVYATETPVLNLPFILRAIPRPESRKVVSFAVQCADGLIGNQSAAQIRAAWNTARDNAWPVTITGPMGDSYTGTIQSPYPQEKAVRRKTPTDKPMSTISLMLLQAILA